MRDRKKERVREREGGGGRERGGEGNGDKHIECKLVGQRERKRVIESKEKE